MDSGYAEETIIIAFLVVLSSSIIVWDSNCGFSDSLIRQKKSRKGCGVEVLRSQKKVSTPFCEGILKAIMLI